MRAAVLCLLLLRFSWGLQPHITVAPGRVALIRQSLMMSKPRPNGLNEDVSAAVEMLASNPKDSTEEIKQDIRDLVNLFVVAERTTHRAFVVLIPPYL